MTRFEESDQKKIDELDMQVERLVLENATLRAAIVELCVYATNSGRAIAAITGKGYTSELVPRFTRLGDVVVSERVLELRKLADAP